MRAQIWRALLAARDAGTPHVLATRLADGQQILLPGAAAEAALLEAAQLALTRDQSALVTVAGGEWFLQVYAPPTRLIIVGAVHIAQALVGFAQALGFAVSVVDPRQSFNSAARFPASLRITQWPDEALAALMPDRRTAVVTLTHDPKLDDPALDAALRSEAFYIAALGSRKSHASRLERLAARGHDAANLKRIFGPAGLALGALSPAEIALSIAAEMVAVRRGAALGARQAA